MKESRLLACLTTYITNPSNLIQTHFQQEIMALNSMQIFYTWFKSHNGQLDTSSMDVIQFPASEGGRGAVALKDIPVGFVLHVFHS